MRRREFIALIGSVVVSWPSATHAQQASQMRRVGVLFGASASNPEFRRRIDALRRGLRYLGWTDADVAFELRFAEGNLNRLPALADELVRANRRHRDLGH